jgi:hypothetical protein
MECDLLNSDVGTCTDKAFKGFARTGWWTPLSNVDPASIVQTAAGVEFALISGQFYEIFDGSKMPFADTAPITTFTGKHGFAQHTDKVAFPLKELSPNSSELIKSLASGIPIVVILEQTDGGAGRFPVYGLYGGLHGSPEMTYELNDERCWEVILESFNTGYPQRFLFDTDEAGTLALFTLLTGYEYISGLTIGSGVSVAKQVTLLTDATPVSYVALPDGGLQTSTAGEINTVYIGIAGNVILIVPKTNTGVSLSDGGDSPADFAGVLSANYATTIGVEGCTGITGIDAPLATDISTGDSGLTLANANVIFLNADANGEEDGNISIATGISYDDLSVAAKAAITSLLAKGWTIIIDDLPT